MSSPANHPLVVWTALLAGCETQTVDLTGTAELKAAQFMCDAQLLESPELNTFTLAPKGEKLLKTLKRLREFSLS